MSRTSPVQIVNKNGVTTTVHKRVDSLSPSLKKAGIPMPVVSSPVDKFALMTEHSFEMSLESHTMSDNVKNKMMATLHPETIPSLANMLRENITTIAVRRAMEASMKRRNFAVLNSMAVLVPEMEDQEVNLQAKVMNILLGIQHNRKPKTPEVDLTNQEDPRSAGVRPLVNALMTVERELTTLTTVKGTQQSFTFKDPEVGNLILDYPDRADEIVDLYRSRGSFDRELFEDALENGVTSLNSGKL